MSNGNLVDQVKIVNMLSTYIALTTPITLSTPQGGTIVDTKGYKEVLFTFNVFSVGTSASNIALKFQHTSSPTGALGVDITNSIVDGSLGTAAFTTLSLTSTNRANGKMSLKVNDGTLNRYICAYLSAEMLTAGTFSIVALLGDALSSPQATKTVLVDP